MNCSTLRQFGLTGVVFMHKEFFAMCLAAGAIFQSVVVCAAPQDGCVERATSHIEEVRCIGERLKALDRSLNDAYADALAAMPENSRQDIRKDREQLRKSQRAWLVYTRENCSLIGGQTGGNNLSVTEMAALCQEQETRSRIKFLLSIKDGTASNP